MKLPDDRDVPKRSKWSLPSCFGSRDDIAQPCDLLDHSDYHHRAADYDSVTEAASDMGGSSNHRVQLARTANKSRKHRQYVVKQISDEIQMNDTTAGGDNLLKALVDMQLEAKFMSSFNHPNILSVRGLSFDNTTPEKFEKPFLILDRLETMTKQMQRWMRIDRQCKGITGAFVGRNDGSGVGVQEGSPVGCRVGEDVRRVGFSVDVIVAIELGRFVGERLGVLHAAKVTRVEPRAAWYPN